MENSLIARRFIRIKALQNLYAYTISQQAHKKEAIEQVEKDFIFDGFLDEPAQREQLAKERTVAVSLFCKTTQEQLAATSFAYVENSKIEQSVRRNLLHYEQALLKDRMFLQNGFNQSKECIYMDHLYILLLLVEWYKLAKERTVQSNQAGNLLQDQLAGLPLLEELYTNSKWISSINQKGVSWPQEPDRLQAWYIRLMQSAEVPKKLIQPLNPDNSIHFLEYIVQTIIFGDKQIRDFFSMIDLYWDEHKRIVQKMLTQTFRMLSTKNFDAFTLFWHQTDEKWAREAAFYNRLLQITLKNSNAYEAMIGQKAEKWNSERIVLIDKLILKLALTEMLEFQKIPLKVSINEYIEMAKLYGTSKSGPFINGILEGILKGLHIDIQQENEK